ncbi:MAG: ParA family protein [Actinomycetaceae bacterium]|nr:ParA family protein [Actinomycetaceae bacterium]
MSDPRKRINNASNAVPENITKGGDMFSDTPLGAEVAQNIERLKKIQSSEFKKPDKTRIIAISNQKGGVGKTTTAVNLAAALALGGLSVLVIDDDPQGNAATALGIPHDPGTPSLYSVLIGEKKLVDILQQSEQLPNLYVAPSTIDLAMVDIELANDPQRNNKLHEALDEALTTLDEMGRHVDYVFIDCPPSMSLLPINALVAAKEVLIPVQCEYYALEGLSQLLRTIESVRDSFNPELEVTTIVLTMYQKATNLSLEVAANVREFFPTQTLSVEIPRSVRVAESPSFGETVVTYEPRSSGAIAYMAAAQELAQRA